MISVVNGVKVVAHGSLKRPNGSNGFRETSLCSGVEEMVVVIFSK